MDANRNRDRASTRDEHISRRANRDKLTVRETAKEFGLSKSHAHRIIKRQREDDGDQY